MFGRTKFQTLSRVKIDREDRAIQYRKSSGIGDHPVEYCNQLTQAQQAKDVMKCRLGDQILARYDSSWGV